MSAFHFTRIQKFENLSIPNMHFPSSPTALQNVHERFITLYNTSRTSEYSTTSFSPYYGHAKITVFVIQPITRDHILLKVLDQCWAQNIEKP